MLWARRDWPRLLAKADENPVSGSACTPSRPVTSALGLCSRVDPLTQPARRARDRRARLMSDILFIKTSSLGDVIHHMPALTEAWRRRRAATFAPATWQEMAGSFRALRKHEYDEIVDTQGLFKSALIARLARGHRHGYDASSIREPVAAWLYDTQHGVDRNLHAIA